MPAGPGPLEPARPLTARERARRSTTNDIVDIARRHVAEGGAADLSLRAVAREMGMVSSAIHRYFPTRDDLLTALIVDAYDSLGATTERRVAETARMAPRRRWVEAASAVRGWAHDQPHLYALLYGTPVPGYAAPERTVDPGIRVSLALLSIVGDAARTGRLGDGLAIPVPRRLAAELRDLADRIALELDPPTMLRTLAAWSQLFGLVSLELFGQTRGVVDDHDALFTTTAGTMAEVIGLE